MMRPLSGCVSGRSFTLYSSINQRYLGLVGMDIVRIAWWKRLETWRQAAERSNESVRCRGTKAAGR